ALIPAELRVLPNRALERTGRRPRNHDRTSQAAGRSTPGRSAQFRKASQRSRRESQMGNQNFRTGIFVSYSHADRDWLSRLRTHLVPYLRGEKLDLWDDTRISAGADWAAEINRVMADARVAVFLVSPDFLASDYVAR